MSTRKNTLIDIRNGKKYHAGNGRPGEGQKKIGADGDDLVFDVPRGTMVKSSEGKLIADLMEVEEFILLKGGRGGKGNTFFKTSVNQAPTHAQPGEANESLDLRLELKLMADIGIIGFPNSGKSTLISRISKARPKVADYPFTTLEPQLGVVPFLEESFVVADIPGLIPGAHQGLGLGIKFLKHIERTNVFVHLIDVSGLSGRDPIQDYRDIQGELMAHDENNLEEDGYRPLQDRTQVVVLNKIDSCDDVSLNEVKLRFIQELNIKPMTISAVTGRGVKELIQKMGEEILSDK